LIKQFKTNKIIITALASIAILSCIQGSDNNPHTPKSTGKVESTYPSNGLSEKPSQPYKKTDTKPILTKGPNVGDLAPDFNFLKPDGSRLTVSSLSQKNNGFLLISFTTW